MVADSTQGDVPEMSSTKKRKKMVQKKKIKKKKESAKRVSFFGVFRKNMGRSLSTWLRW